MVDLLCYGEEDGKKLFWIIYKFSNKEWGVLYKGNFNQAPKTRKAFAGEKVGVTEYWKPKKNIWLVKRIQEQLFVWD